MLPLTTQLVLILRKQTWMVANQLKVSVSIDLKLKADINSIQLKSHVSTRDVRDLVRLCLDYEIT